MNKIWYQKNTLSYLLLPFSFLYFFIIFIRKILYQFNILKKTKIKVPVIVVGNITVGGTGKTPFVISIANALKEAGFKPGIITRGYRGKSLEWPIIINQHSDARLAGDEAVLIAQKTLLPVVVGPNRVEDAKKLLENFDCNLIISDDGLQHTALIRDIEIAMIDDKRGFGNGFLLPAGPLREPSSRILSVDFVVVNNGNCDDPWRTEFMIDEMINIKDRTKKLKLADITDQKIYAVAGIGNPDYFFNQLRGLYLEIIPIVFSDHHDFKFKDIDFEKNAIIIMTEKDAVKCKPFADHRHFMAAGHAEIDKKLIDKIILKIHSGE